MISAPWKEPSREWEDKLLGQADRKYLENTVLLCKIHK